MGVLLEWVRRALGALHHRRDSELEEELRLHLELAAEDAARQGLSAEEAGRAARIRAGGVAQALEVLRDQRGVPILAGLGQDLRLAIRSLGAAPVVTTTAVVSLALVIGANTAIFSIVNSLLLRALPVHEPLRLVHVTDSVRRENGDVRIRAWSYPAWEQIRQRPHLFEAVTAWSSTRFNLAAGGEAQFIEGLWADGGFFETLGVRPVLGRTFSSLDDQRGGGPDGPVAVISYGYWHRQFGGAADTIGRLVRLNDVPFTIVGVAPPEFFGMEVGRAFDIIVPLGTEPLVRGLDSALDSASTNFLSIIARLKSDQSVDAAAIALRSVQPEIRRATLQGWDESVLERYLTSPFTLLPASTGDSNLRRSYERPLLVLALIVALVLLVGCVNVANLLLARTAARRHELSVQVAMGASRWRLARQFIAESFALSGAGAVLGVCVAAYSSRFLVGHLSTPTNVVFLDVSIDRRVLAFTAIVTALTTLLFGTAPAMRATTARPMEALTDRSRASSDTARGDFIGWLVTVQVALSLVLVVAAGLFIRSFASLASRELGFRPDQVLVVTINSERAMIDPVDRVPLYERVRAAALQLPDVAEAGVSFLTPIGGGGFTPPIEFSTNTGPVRLDADTAVFGNLISPGWFATYGMRLVAGRELTDRDRRGAPGVAIVNETFARRFLNGASPLGQTLTVYPHTPRALHMQVVGVVADAVNASLRESVPPMWYMPITQFTPLFPFASARLSVRSRTTAPALLVQSLAAAITSVNPKLTLTFRPLEDQIHASLTRERLMAQLAGFFGGLALLLAGLGLYGGTAYAIACKRAEIGIRLALGATPGGVVRTILTRASSRVGVGITAGVVASVWTWKFIDGLIYGLRPGDPATLLAASVVLSAIALTAAWLPARRAARMDPVTVLRDT